MAKTDFFNRIEQEIGYGNYSEIRRITLTILRNNPDNKDASYIRDYIEYHKKSNGRYESISLDSYLYYISNNIRKFKHSTDNKFFLICIYKDLYHLNIYDYDDGLSVLCNRNTEIKKVLDLLKQLNNPDLENLINRLNKIYNDLNEQIEQKEQREREWVREQREREERQRFLEQEEARKKEREAKIKVITFIFAAIVCIVAFAIKCS